MLFEGIFGKNLPILLVGLLIGFVIGFCLLMLASRFSKEEADKKIKLLNANIAKEKNISEYLLREIEVGILAYSGGKLLTANPSAKELLNTGEIPKSLTMFLREYGRDNGLQAAVALQPHDISGQVQIDERIVLIHMKQAILSAGVKIGWLVILQDITKTEREELRRKEFVANVSHELKTPLTTIKAYIESLLDWGLAEESPQKIRENIEKMEEDAKRMTALVENLLLLSQIDSQLMNLRMTQYNPVKIMRSVLSQMQVQADEKHIKLSMSVLSIIPPVFGEAHSLERILTNLVSNAIKYTQAGGIVTLSVQLTNEYISLKVSDNGMGVSTENVNRLFERFFRVDSTGSRQFGGTGLGLSIAKELTEIQGGQISVESQVGKGTTFFVTIPKAELVYSQTIEAYRSGSPRSEPIYRSAGKFLSGALMEIDSTVEELQNLSDPRKEELIQYLLHDQDDELAGKGQLHPLEIMAKQRERAEKGKKWEDTDAKL